MISDQYRELNRELHKDQSFGAKGSRWAGIIGDLIAANEIKSVLDYGCGKGSLLRALTADIDKTGYDPSVPEFSAAPKPAELLTCTDVLEHIEPELLDATLAEMAGLTEKAAFLVIATRPAKKTLPDGRNAHLIQADPRWWLPKLWKFWRVESIVWDGKELIVTAGAIKP